MAKICKHAIVSGIVQGVFYRVSAQKQAMYLNISGYAKNLADGTVEVVACGESSNVDKLIAWLNIGPQGARVDNVLVFDTATEQHTDLKTHLDSSTFEVC